MSPHRKLAAAAARPDDRRHLRLVVEHVEHVEHVAPSAPGEPRCDFAAEQFLSGHGWAWRVTAALSRARRAAAAARAWSA